METHETGNSGTRIGFDPAWTVVDIGSGHNPHPRADLLVERYIGFGDERGGRPIGEHDAPLVVADASALPFRQSAFDFAICSHVAEHVEDPSSLCRELGRVSSNGYLETPGYYAEFLRHQSRHRWAVRRRRGGLLFRGLRPTHPLGPVGKAFYSAYFAGTVHVAEGEDVYSWARSDRTLGKVLRRLRRLLVRMWVRLTPLTYTRFEWNGPFAVEVVRSARGSRD